MSDLIFKINVETDSGREYSWYSSSFARSDEVSITTTKIVDRINNLWSASYTNDASVIDPSDVHGTTATNFGSNVNTWLSASHNGDSDGSIIFNHTDSQDTADRLRRYRFWGTKVCNVLGFPEGQWQYPVNFQLADNENDINFFSGDISANRLTVSSEVSLSPISKVTSNIRFDIHDTDLFVQFTSGSAANRLNRVLFGYNTDNDRFELDAGIQNTADTGNDRYNSFLRFGTGSFYHSSHTKLTTTHISPAQEVEIRPQSVGLSGGAYEYLDNPCYGFSKNQAAGAGGNMAHCSFALGVARSPVGGPVSGSVFQVSDLVHGEDDRTMYLRPTFYHGNTRFDVCMPMVISSSLSAGTITPLNVLGYDSSNISITAQRDVAAYSDIRHKKDIETIQGSLDTINNIRGVTFYSKEESGSRRMGVIAQELEPYLPEIVTTDKSGYKTVKYANLTALLIQGMKEQQEQIEELKKEIEEIKNG
jgi:hypothetical protein